MVKFYVVDGNISAGKSVACRKIKKFFPDYVVIIEPSFENPFLGKYYENPKIFCRDIENWLIDKRIESYKLALRELNKGKTVVMDRSIFSSLQFVEMNYIKGNLLKKAYFILKEKIMNFIKKVRKPDEIIVLDCNPKICFQRKNIRKDQVDGLECESLISLEYLQDVNKAINDWLTFIQDEYNIPISRINWENFDNGHNTKEFYRDYVLSIK